MLPFGINELSHFQAEDPLEALGRMCTHDEGALEEEFVGIASEQANPITIFVLHAETEELGGPKLQIGRERPGVTREIGRAHV